MPSTDVENWLRSGQFASIDGIRLMPQNNQILKGIPLSISRGQAEAFFLVDNQGQEWILKKFLPGRNPDGSYIRAIQSLIPQQPGFDAGRQRKVLTKGSLIRSGYYSTALALWIENTILMPKIKGGDWADLADKLRDRRISLSKDQLFLLCKDISEKVHSLEIHNLAHRDLSSTNILIDTTNWRVHLIDWDSLYAPSLSMPPNTTYGTNGYVAPFVRSNGIEDPRVTWRRLSDRFSLAILNVEFLSLDKGSPLTGDGGIFEQTEIYNRGGPGLTKIIANLQRNFPNTVGLLQRALSAANFDACPGPDEWIAFCGAVATAAPLAGTRQSSRVSPPVSSSPPPRAISPPRSPLGYVVGAKPIPSSRRQVSPRPRGTPSLSWPARINLWTLVALALSLLATVPSFHLLAGLPALVCAIIGWRTSRRLAGRGRWVAGSAVALSVLTISPMIANELSGPVARLWERITASSTQQPSVSQSGQFPVTRPSDTNQSNQRLPAKPNVNSNTDLRTNSETQTPQVAILRIFSNLDGVAVSVDGNFRGTVSVNRPIQIAVSPGQHTVQAAKSGYGPWEYSPNLAAKSQQNISIEMVPAGPTPQELAHEYLQKADRLLSQRRYDDAMTACNEGLRWDPGNQSLLVKKAEVEIARQDYLTALREEEERRRRADQQTIEKRPETFYESFQPAVALDKNKVKPIYPEIARSVRVYGKVIVQVTIDDRGNVTSARVLEGPPLLQRAAIDAAKRWKYRPARRGNRAVEDTQTIAFNFTL